MRPGRAHLSTTRAPLKTLEEHGLIETNSKHHPRPIWLHNRSIKHFGNNTTRVQTALECGEFGVLENYIHEAKKGEKSPRLPGLQQIRCCRLVV